MEFSITASQISVFAADIVSTKPTTGNVPVKLSQAATRFFVSVPTVLPVDVDKNGNVTTASDNRIINNSFGPVEVNGMVWTDNQGYEIVLLEDSLQDDGTAYLKLGNSVQLNYY